MKLKILLGLFLVSQFLFSQLPDGFVYVKQQIPSIQTELRYYSGKNFIGKPITGYNKNVIILSAQATRALKKAQEELETFDLSLKIYDAYRPQRAVNHFIAWAKDLSDTIMKHEYYPEVDKKNLFKDQYIASKSRHSSGSTLDVTLIDRRTGEELDMGTPYDYFGPQSWIHFMRLTTQQKANRLLLQNIMTKHGFRPYPWEWWHFTLRGEPFRNQHFDFPVE
ncbi:MAG: M15 family metallopeptidase [Flavobacteriaceae bacterium]|nr:M15 family metallopeptidase [Bacteroidia bacterium]NNL16734.1 M15 family metallopeptidase [Flavobacteriaceae bacterium]